MGTGIYGSKPPEFEGAARRQGLFTLPYIPSNRAINHEQSTHVCRHHSNIGYKLETTAGANKQLKPSLVHLLSWLLLLNQLSWKC